MRGDICSQCCGTEREVSVDCPLDCEYLLEARRRERFDEVDPKLFPNLDIRITEEFLDQNERLVEFLSRSFLTAALSTPGAMDQDIRTALDSMIKTLRTRHSGLIYETRPDSPLAGMIQQRVFQGLGEYRQAMAQRTGVSSVRDADVLGVLVLLERIALSRNNQRPRGRSLISFLLERHGAGRQETPGPMIVP
ncbi:MAG: hypothetical protein HY235_09235 [Acidobacteria bacterium]|nr:hypothetical protein [Acidobacteriota bacterium]